MNSNSVKLYRDQLSLIEKDILESGQRPGYYSRRILTNTAVAIYVRKTYPQGTKGIAIETSIESVKHTNLSQSSRGFQVSTELATSAEGKRVCRVTICLGEPAFEVVFAELVGHLLDHIEDSESEAKAIATLQSQLILWRKFFDSEADTGLSERAQTGLYGELTFINFCLESGISAIHVLNAWTGPKPEECNKDFTFGSCAVEIKSSSATEANRVYISSIRQLDDTGLEELFLHHIVFDRRPSTVQTLPQLVRTIQKSIEEQDISLKLLFIDLLKDAGYLHIHEPLYSNAGYTLRYENSYRVDEFFPRLLEGEIPHGVIDVEYGIDLATAANCKTEKSDILKGTNLKSI